PGRAGGRARRGGGGNRRQRQRERERDEPHRGAAPAPGVAPAVRTRARRRSGRRVLRRTGRAGRPGDRPGGRSGGGSGRRPAHRRGSWNIAPPRAIVSGHTVILALIKTLRPRQWVKNSFVAAPLFFSLRLLDSQSVLRTVAAVALFSLIS